MTSTVAALKSQFDMQTRLFNNVLEGISEDESNTRKSDNTNHIKWIAGHMLNSRINTLSKITGGEANTDFAAQFGRGVSLDAEASYPPIEQIIAEWNKASPAISSQLAKLPEEALEARAPFQGPIADESLRGLLAFMNSHEAYHVGQLSILRKMSGKDAMSYR